MRCFSPANFGSALSSLIALTGINPGKSHGQGPWVNHERHRLDDSSSANRRKRSCSILLLGNGDYRKAKASAHKARVTDCVLVVLDGGRRTSDTWGTIYPASGPRRENPTCCLSDLLLMKIYRGAVRALVERDLSSPMRGDLELVS